MTAAGMTEAEAAWLRKLRDDGPQDIRVLFESFPRAGGCLGLGWTQWSGDPMLAEGLTHDGLAALAQHEADE